MNEPVIDAWVQHFDADVLADPIFASILRWIGVDSLPPEIPFAMTKGAMDAAGVGRGLLSAWWGPRGPMVGNDQVAAWVAAHPERFAGVCAVDLARPMEAVRELRRCVSELGFVALRMLPWLWDAPPNDRRYYPLYAACVDLGVPFCLQVGHTGPLAPSEPGRPIPYLERVALDFPELVIVGGHIGAPWTEEMIFLTRKYPNIYIDTSAYKPSRYPEALVTYLRGRGREKVLFGSNFPMVQPRAALAELDLLKLDDEARRLFLHDNAARVFGLT